MASALHASSTCVLCILHLVKMVLLCRSDVAHKAAHKVNKGLDKAQNKQQDAYESSASKDDVKEHGQQALDSAKDMAVQTKCALPYLLGKLIHMLDGREGGNSGGHSRESVVIITIPVIILKNI